jgi:hypothetical protein
MNWDASREHARPHGRRRIQKSKGFHVLELTATCLSALLLTLSLVLPAFASGVSSDQSESSGLAAQIDDSSSSFQDSSSSENVAGGGHFSD